MGNIQAKNRLEEQKADESEEEEEDEEVQLQKTQQTQMLQNILGVGPATPMGQELVHINPPKLEDYSSEDESDEDEDEARPLTHEELKAKTLKNLHRRSNRDAKNVRKANTRAA